MAIRALNSVVVANYSTDKEVVIRAGDGVRLTTTGVVTPAYRQDGSFDTKAEQLRFVGFSADDTGRTGNTMILNDPVGSSYVDTSFNLQAANNGFYVVAKRAIGDFQSENVTSVTNPTAGSSGFEGPRRGIGVYNTPGGQFVTDRFAATAVSSLTLDASGLYSAYQPGDMLSIAAAIGDSGKLVKFTDAQASLGSSFAVVVGRVDSFDSAAGLLYFTQISPTIYGL